MKSGSFVALFALLVTFASGQDNSPTSLPPEYAQRLKDGWSKLQGIAALPAPTVGICVFTSSSGKEGRSGTPTEQIILDDLRSQFTNAGIVVVSQEIVSKGLQSLNRAMERRGTEEIALRAAELLSESQKADIAVIVQLMLNADGTAIRQFRAFDLRHSPARPLPSQSYRALPLVPPADQMQQAFWFQAQRQGTTAYLMRLAEAVASSPSYVPTYRLQILGLTRSDHERWMRAIRRQQRPGLELPRTPFEFGTEKPDVTPLLVRFSGEWLDLKEVLEATAKETLDRSLLTVFDSGGLDFIITLQEQKEPTFFMFAAKDAAPPQKKVGPALSPNRRPTVVILYGSDVDAAHGALLDERVVQSGLSLDEESAARTLGRYFQASGFEVKDPSAFRRQLEQEIARANRGKNLSGLRDALRRFNTVDLAVLVRKDPPGKSMALTVLNGRGAQVAFANFPDLRHRLYEEFVDVRDAASLMRYLGGTLLSQLNDQVQDASLRSIEVMIKNTRDAQQVMTIANAFRGLAGVKSVTDLKIDQPLGGFIVNTTDDVGSLIGRAAELAGRKQLGAKGIVEVANEQQLVLNVAPDWLIPFDSTEAEKKTDELQKPNSTKPIGIVDALRIARDSVWAVVLEFPDGRIDSQGTAWSVRAGMLATNAHVYFGLLEAVEEYQKRGITVQIAARSGENLDRRVVIELSRSKAHPAYKEFESIYETREFRQKYNIQLVTPYDVAILVTSGNAGPPLPLASPADIASLQPLDAIGYCGYPAENRLGNGNSQQSLLGTINTITTVFLRDSKEAGKGRIIHFSLPAAGGASGSPIFGPSGKVIGLLSAGDNVMAQIVAKDSAGAMVLGSRKRVPLGFTYGQRVDMLSELIEGKIDVAALQREWERDFQSVRRQLAGN